MKYGRISCRTTVRFLDPSTTSTVLRQRWPLSAFTCHTRVRVAVQYVYHSLNSLLSKNATSTTSQILQSVLQLRDLGVLVFSDLSRAPHNSHKSITNKARQKASWVLIPFHTFFTTIMRTILILQVLYEKSRRILLSTLALDENKWQKCTNFNIKNCW